MLGVMESILIQSRAGTKLNRTKNDQFEYIFVYLQTQLSK
jgi:hypothetical protein